MKNKILPLILFLFVSSVSYAQEYDSAYDEYDSAYVEDSADDESSNAISTATFTINDPANLPATKDNNDVEYSRNDFDKAKWKDIIGETNYNEKKIEEKEEKKTTSSQSIPAPVWSGAILKIIGFGLIFALAIIVLYFLVKNTFADEFIIKKDNSDTLLFDNQHIEEVSDQDIESLLKRALAANDFRVAVRLYYIRLLKHLHNTRFIAWKKDKTNRDYSYELAATPILTGFQKITLAYEIIWYGERTPSSKEFEILQRSFGELHDLTATVLS